MNRMDRMDGSCVYLRSSVVCIHLWSNVLGGLYAFL